METKPPNILLVMFDQMSAQSLPCYGHAVVKAPHLQALAERGRGVRECLLQLAALLAVAVRDDDGAAAEPHRRL